MWRIKEVADCSSMVTLRVEGLVTTHLVSVLTCVCRRFNKNKKRVCLDLAELSFTDRAAFEMVEALPPEGVDLINASHLVELLGTVAGGE